LVISHILGGLGNQMFQYSAGRALSLARGVDLKLDISDFSCYNLHNGFELDKVFNCQFEYATKSDIDEVLSWRAIPIFRKFISNPFFNTIRSRKLIIEPSLNYWDGFHSLPSSCYLSGYWQSLGYFKHFEKKIREDFIFRLPLLNKNRDVANLINSTNSVSLHVRRGDYVKDLKTARIHGTCSLDYYQSAILHIKNKIKNPFFIIFSDDIEWVRENIKLNFNSIYVDHNIGDASFYDLHLMTLCQNHIIANSSFSWWGAWLSKNNKKIVICPKIWFADRSKEVDLAIDGWIQF
jgi:hypothetical protein